MVTGDFFTQFPLFSQIQGFTGGSQRGFAARLARSETKNSCKSCCASIGPENMEMSMQSTPGFVGDTQRVEIKNDQVHAVIDVYSATAEIAGWSVVNTLLNITSPIVFF